MKFEQIGLTEQQEKALNRKKIYSVESLVRNEPLHYYDFRNCYEIDINNIETRAAAASGNPFAVTGVCVRFSVEKKKHMRMVKLRVKPVDHTKDGMLYVSHMNYGQFRAQILDHMSEDNGKIPEECLYYKGIARMVAPKAAEQIKILNSGAGSMELLLDLKLGGRDGWSSMLLTEASEILGGQVICQIRGYTSDREVQLNACRWYCRGLRLDLAVQKALSDSENYIKSILLGKQVFVGGNIHYDEQYGAYSVLNPPVISTDLDKYRKYMVQYRAVKGISQTAYAEMVERGLAGIDTEDFLPTAMKTEFHIPSFYDAVHMLHHPDCVKDICTAERRFVVDDLTYLAVKLAENRKETRGLEGPVFTSVQKMREYAQSLPYDLTGDQKKAVNTVYRTIRSGRSANVLVQGDVGTGKTAVAVCLMLLAAENGYQSALAAPYTTLAGQHYSDLKEAADCTGFKVVFLTSDIKGKERKHALEMIRSGEADLIVGTHSIFGQDVTYHNLGLVISDEEHKFGVLHRNGLKGKGIHGCHNITMSATPIPKSSAAILYSGMEIITIKDHPANRLPIKSVAVMDDRRPLEFMKKEVENGHQCYVVCPSIGDEKEDNDCDGEEKKQRNLKLPSIAEKEKIYRTFCSKNGISIAVVTGKMKAGEKERAMKEFADGKTDVLMATTVIEVGINVPNATVILVTGAEYFGMATLHQLRGRVGRGNLQSYCIFQGDPENEKLKFLCGTTDGFEVAEQDLKMRGPGSLFGERQSGSNYFISLMLANTRLYQQIVPYADQMVENGTAEEYVCQYEKIFPAEEKR